MITYAQINFFQAEVNNEESGGVTPATLDSAIDSLHQAPADIIVEWADDDTVREDNVQEFIDSIIELREKHGGEVELVAFLPS